MHASTAVAKIVPRKSVDSKTLCNIVSRERVKINTHPRLLICMVYRLFLVLCYVSYSHRDRAQSDFPFDFPHLRSLFLEVDASSPNNR